MKSYQQFFAELKRRKVFRVMAVYGVIGFGVIEAAGEIFPRVGIPDWAVTLVVWLILLGFPVAVVLAWAFESSPEGMKRTLDATPGEIEAIVGAPVSQRIPSGLMALFGVAALVLGAYWAGTRTAGDSVTAAPAASDARLASLSPDDERPSIAVLPFRNMSGEGEQDFSDGMTEEITNVLVNAGRFRVRGRMSALGYREQEPNVRRLSEDLGVDYLVEGSVRRGGETLRITARLLDATTDEQLWSDRYDEELTIANVLWIQTDIAEAIAEALTVPLGLEEASDLVTPTGDLETYDLYLAGRSAMRKRGKHLIEAAKLFEAAIALDSAFAPAWASLAESLEISVWYPGDTYDDIADSLARSRFLEQSEAAARRALELDSGNASALIALASVHRDRARWSDAERLYRRALDIDPENAEAHQQLADLLAHRGRLAEAVSAIDRATGLDPAPVRLLLLMRFLHYDDRWDEALEVLRYGMERAPETFLYSAASMLPRSGDIEEAAEYMDRWLQVRPPEDSTWTRESLERIARGIATGTALEQDDWDLDPQQWMWVGQPDSAVVDLVRDELLAGIPYSPWVWSPEFDAVRSDPRFQQYLESLGLSDAVLQRTPVEDRKRPMILDRAP